MGSKPVAGGERSDTSGFPASHLTRPRRVSKQITPDPSGPTCTADWPRLSIDSLRNANCAAAGGLIRCDPVGVDVIRAAGFPEVALRWTAKTLVLTPCSVYATSLPFDFVTARPRFSRDRMGREEPGRTEDCKLQIEN